MTPDWTDRHTAVALAMAVAGAGTLVGLAEPYPYAWVVGGAVVAVAVGALATEALGGLVIGLVGAAGLIGVKQAGGAWEAHLFWPSLLETIALLSVGLASARAGERLGERRPGPGRPADPAAGTPGRAQADPAFGSLGLLSAELAMARLEEEVERATVHERPLAVVLFTVEVTEEGLSTDAREAAFRAIGRAVESRLRDTDVPFALTASELGAVLPEADTLQAWDRIGPIMDACQVITFRDRSVAAPRALADAAELRVGLAVLGVHGRSAGALLDAAIVNSRAESASRA